MSEFWTAFKNGNRLVAEQKYVDAAVEYRSAISSSSDPTEHALALETLYITAIRTGDIKAGIRFLEKAIEADRESPHMIRMLCALARQYTFAQRKAEALEIQSRIFASMDWSHALTAGYDFTSELWFSGNYKTFDSVLGAVKTDFDAINILEIGSLQGMSCCYMADHVDADRLSSLICVDPHFQPEYRTNVARSLAPNNIFPIELKSQDALSYFEENRFQLVHVDGWHVAPQVFLDGFLGAKILVDGGYIIFDDYLKEDQTSLGQTVKIGVQAFLSVFGTWFEPIIDGRQLVCKRRGSIDPTQVSSRASHLLRGILDRDVVLTGNSLGEIYCGLQPHFDALFGASWVGAHIAEQSNPVG